MKSPFQFFDVQTDVWPLGVKLANADINPAVACQYRSCLSRLVINLVPRAFSLASEGKALGTRLALSCLVRLVVPQSEY